MWLYLRAIRPLKSHTMHSHRRNIRQLKMKTDIAALAEGIAMFCTRCGNPQNDDAAYCSNCGAPLASHAQPVGQSADPAGATRMTDTTAGPNLGGPEDLSHASARPQGEARPSPQGDPILRA